MMWILARKFLPPVWVLLSTATAFSTQTASNLEFLASLTDSLVDQRVRELSRYLTNGVFIQRLEPDPEFDWFFENRLIEVLGKYHVEPLYLHLADLGNETGRRDDSTGTTIQFKVLSLGIEYEQMTEGQAQRAVIRRKGKVGFFLRAIDRTSGRILSSGECRASKLDRLQPHQVDGIEDSNVGFTRGTPARGLGSNKLLGTLLMTGATGVIVYLFYSLRSR